MPLTFTFDLHDTFVFTDFLIAVPLEIFYPRDRIIHIIISALVFLLIACVINIINSDSLFFRITVFVLLSAKMIFLIYGFSEYFRMFYGNGNFGIVTLTIVIFVMIFKMNDKSLGQTGGFYIVSNFILITMLIMCAKRIDVINIHSTGKTFEFSADKLFLFFDVFTISAISSDKKTKFRIQKRYIVISSVVFIFISILQGLSIKGELLYSLSPLQSLIQIFSGNTVRRYDYIFNLFFTFNYFGAVIMYSAVLKKILNTEKYFENN